MLDPQHAEGSALMSGYEWGGPVSSRSKVKTEWSVDRTYSAEDAWLIMLVTMHDENDGTKDSLRDVKGDREKRTHRLLEELEGTNMI